MEICEHASLPSRAPLAIALISALSLGSLHESAWASSTLAVTDCGDTGAGATLRNVIASAASGDTINVSACANATITLSGSEIALLQSTLTIVGPNDDSLIVDANHASRVLDQTAANGTLTLQHLKLRNGALTAGYAAGGCVYAKSALVLQNTTVSGCSVSATAQYGQAFGGALYSLQAVTLTSSTLAANTASAIGSNGTAAGGGVAGLAGLVAQNSTISGNAAIGVYASGGGIYAKHDVTITATTIDSNKSCAESACTTTSGNGGGLFIEFINNPYIATIVDSTISGNIAGAGSGGAYLGDKTTKIYNCTVAFNAAGSVTGGVYIVLGAGNGFSSTLQSSIIANNTVKGTGNADLHSGVTFVAASANNLIVDANQSPAGTLKTDPQLGPLAYHGGPTRTHALNPASPAVDAGNDVIVPALSVDQRGFARTAAHAPDIGAYERQANDDEIFYNGFQ